MAKKKAEPVITYTEILAIAGEYIRGTVLNLRKEVETLYRIQTGTELGITEELGEEDEDQ